MAAPCFESQTQDKLKIPPVIAKAFMNEAMEHIKGGRSYPEALQSMSEKSGLQPNTINTILKRDPKVFSLTKQAIAKSGQVRIIRNAADAFAGELKTNGAVYEPGKIAKAWDLQRRAALAGHSPIFPWSHMRDWSVQLPTTAGRERMAAFWRAATDVYKYRGEKGQALYEMDMSLMQMGDRYDFWKQASADIMPGKRSPGDMLLQNRKPSWQTRNFDALKPARYSSLEGIWDRTDPALKEGDAGKAYAAAVARDLNYATGSVMPPTGEAANPLAKTASEVSNAAGRYNLLMSTKLFFAKHMNATLTPLRYLAKTGRMEPWERAAANVALGRWGNIVTTQLGILGVNYAFNKMMGWETPNLTDMSKGDFLRLKVGGFTVPFSPTLEALRLPIVFTATMLKGQPKEAGGKLWTALWNAAHPAFHTGYEQVSGKDFFGRPVTWSLRNALAQVAPSTAPKYQKSKEGEPVGLLEYGTTKAPIALGAGLHEFYSQLRNQGVSASMSMMFIKSAIAAASSALVGTHIYEQQEPEPKPTKRFNRGSSRGGRGTSR